jgi:hypothetical protein
LEPSAELPNVWAGMMEMDVDGDTATIVAVGEGSTSMYLSTGGGVIGGGMHERVVQANHHFLVALESNLDALAPEDERHCPRETASSFGLSHMAAAARRKRRNASSTQAVTL